MKLLVCGTRTKNLNRAKITMAIFDYIPRNDTIEIVEGCCMDSPDEVAEELAQYKSWVIKHFPSNKGNYLKRNIEMIEYCTHVLAFWDGYSYGTAHTIAQAVLHGKPVKIIQVKK